MYSRHLVTTALVAMLRTVTGKGVGDGKAPAPTGTNPLPDVPYAVVYPHPHPGLVDRDYIETDPDVALVYQVTSVGNNRQQAEWMADKVRQAVLGRNSGGAFTNAVVLSDGHKVANRDLEETGPTAYEGELVSTHESFALYVTPA